MGRAREILLEVARCIRWDLMRVLGIPQKPEATQGAQVEMSEPTVRLRSTRIPYLSVVESTAAEEDRQHGSAGDGNGHANSRE